MKDRTKWTSFYILGAHALKRVNDCDDNSLERHVKRLKLTLGNTQLGIIPYLKDCCISNISIISIVPMK